MQKQTKGHTHTPFTGINKTKKMLGHRKKTRWFDSTMLQTYLVIANTQLSETSMCCRWSGPNWKMTGRYELQQLLQSWFWCVHTTYFLQRGHPPSWVWFMFTHLSTVSMSFHVHETDHSRSTYTGRWLSHRSEKYEFLSWDHEIPNWMEK